MRLAKAQRQAEEMARKRLVAGRAGRGVARAILQRVIEAQMARAQLACGFRWSGVGAPVQGQQVQEQL
jgi:hypothetical protein